MNDPLSSLLLLPHPKRYESTSSWLVRLACLHGSPVSQILFDLDLSRNRDWDLGIGPRSAARLAQGSNLIPQNLQAFVSRFDSFRRHRWLRRWLRLNEYGAARSGFCSRCLRDDVVPHLRFEWRMRYWMVCPTHGSRILTHCPACQCNDPVALDGQHNAVPFAQCRSCGVDLRFLDLATLECGVTEQLAQLQLTVTAAILREGFMVVGIEEWIPLAVLPSLLAAGVLPQSRDESLPLAHADPRLLDDVRRSIHQVKAMGRLYASSDVVASRGNTRGKRVWKGDIGTLCEIAVKQRFRWPLAAAELDVHQRA
ncbi:TniQ family protein [Achromobacter spanius]|uniref:TniQ family protein n=1 Tax=Achromobacter spanius TaxID=217203 RepID=UPI0036F12421